MLTGPVLVLAGLPLLAVFAVIRVWSGATRARVVLEVLFGLYLLMLANVVLFPLRIDPRLRADDAVWDYASFTRNWMNLTPFASIRQLLERPSPTQALRQIAGNVLLLAPLGAALPVLYPRMRRFRSAAIAIVASALGIEVVQYLARVARLSLRSIDIDDAILNVVGGLLGFAAWLLWSRTRRAEDAQGDAA